MPGGGGIPCDCCCGGGGAPSPGGGASPGGSTGSAPPAGPEPAGAGGAPLSAPWCAPPPGACRAGWGSHQAHHRRGRPFKKCSKAAQPTQTTHTACGVGAVQNAATRSEAPCTPMTVTSSSLHSHSDVTPTGTHAHGQAAERKEPDCSNAPGRSRQAPRCSGTPQRGPNRPSARQTRSGPLRGCHRRRRHQDRPAPPWPLGGPPAASMLSCPTGRRQGLRLGRRQPWGPPRGPPRQPGLG